MLPHCRHGLLEGTSTTEVRTADDRSAETLTIEVGKKEQQESTDETVEVLQAKPMIRVMRETRVRDVKLQMTID